MHLLNDFDDEESKQNTGMNGHTMMSNMTDGNCVIGAPL